MVLKLYTLFDKAAAVFNAPFSQRSRGEAVRNFKMLLEDQNSLPFKFPQDYTLYEIGEFDDSNGSIQMHEHPELMYRGSDHIRDLASISPTVVQDIRDAFQAKKEAS